MIHRLLDQPGDDFERALLASATIDLPDAAQVQRGVAAITATATAFSATSAGASTAAGATAHALTKAAASGGGGVALIGKWVSIGLVAGFVSVGGGTLVARTLPAERSPTSVDVPARPIAPIAPASPPEQRRPYTEPTQAIDEAHVVPSRPTPVRARTRTSAPLSSDSPMSAAPIDQPSNRETLSAEIEALSRARLALAARSPDEVRRALDEYDRVARVHVLDAEATMLRLEALVQSGQADVASRLAREYLTMNPASPHRARLQQIIVIDDRGASGGH